MPASLAATQIVLDAGWLMLAGPVIAVVLYLWARRASQSSTVTESKVLTVKTVENIKELWDKRDDLKKDITDLRERMARLEGAHDAKGCFPHRPPAA